MILLLLLYECIVKMPFYSSICSSLFNIIIKMRKSSSSCRETIVESPKKVFILSLSLIE